MSERKPTKTKEPAVKKAENLISVLNTQTKAPEPVVGLTVPQVAQRLQLNQLTVLRLLQSGKLVGIKVGRPWRIHPDALRDFLMRRASLPAASAPVPQPSEKAKESPVRPAKWR